MDFEVSEEFEVKVGMQQGSVFLLFHFAIVIDAELAMVCMLSELMYADDLLLMCEAID